ncbi:cyclin-domain-containing protein [Pyronema domesticum]|uniref:Similar to PHO85 cyclin-7 acc. no. P40186 n=1 Tax=Pyronema omphalodes (strain CBS 100304) TaxID=1076935 RepID=U4L7W0_PYROM|nr:cyclin-domain-containing protein [Pyronema domesticum]CCX13238.1 Similar to PHO85 cyclin-7; acc. no. P40186 [Pyronema omphalodes CBS 100304]
MLQVGLRSENIMITHPEPREHHRPPLPHTSSTPVSEQWPRSTTSSSSVTPNPQNPSTRQQPATVVRHHGTGTSARPQNPTPTTLLPEGSTAASTPAVAVSTAPSAAPAPATIPTSPAPSVTSLASRDPRSGSLSPSRKSDVPSVPPRSPPTVLRNLDHIVQLAKEDAAASLPSSPTRRRSVVNDTRRYEISSMPVGDVIEMVAALLTKITTTNDKQHDSLRLPSADGGHTMNQTTNSVLAFHGKNVPSITILSYLSRIHKYCPTTYEVFISLLVYFDRMTERVNKRNAEGDQQQDGRHVFVVDSYNIHRLVIAGVTCASKFFSDVFYTNSRYAKVGGLPLQELNHLELQFLILNDFRLSVPVEELEAYGTMLVQFYAREALAKEVE